MRHDEHALHDGVHDELDRLKFKTEIAIDLLQVIEMRLEEE